MAVEGVVATDAELDHTLGLLLRQRSKTRQRACRTVKLILKLLDTFPEGGDSAAVIAYVARAPKSIYELHSTILYLLGLNYEELTYRFNGRDFRLTDVAGNVVREIIA